MGVDTRAQPREGAQQARPRTDDGTRPWDVGVGPCLIIESNAGKFEAHEGSTALDERTHGDPNRELLDTAHHASRCAREGTEAAEQSTRAAQRTKASAARTERRERARRAAAVGKKEYLAHLLEAVVREGCEAGGRWLHLVLRKPRCGGIVCSVH